MDAHGPKLGRPPSLLDLPGEAMTIICSHILDQRDIASLRSTCKALRQVYNGKGSEGLWNNLISIRFLSHTIGDAHSIYLENEDSFYLSRYMPAKQANFLYLASLRYPVCVGDIAWLDGTHLSLISNHSQSIGSVWPTVVSVRSVCWLDLSISIPGVLPGRYMACWRVKAISGYRADVLKLVAVEPISGTILASSSSREVELRRMVSNAGGDWFELSLPLEVKQLCAVTVELSAKSGVWKRGLLFDEVRLVRVRDEAPSAACEDRGIVSTVVQRVANFLHSFW